MYNPARNELSYQLQYFFQLRTNIRRIESQLTGILKTIDTYVEDLQEIYDHKELEEDVPEVQQNLLGVLSQHESAVVQNINAKYPLLHFPASKVEIFGLEGDYVIGFNLVGRTFHGWSNWQPSGEEAEELIEEMEVASYPYKLWRWSCDKWKEFRIEQRDDQKGFALRKRISKSNNDFHPVFATVHGNPYLLVSFPDLGSTVGCSVKYHTNDNVRSLHRSLIERNNQERKHLHNITST